MYDIQAVAGCLNTLLTWRQSLPDARLCESLCPPAVTRPNPGRLAGPGPRPDLRGPYSADPHSTVVAVV
jgi:hypothetical protein